MSMCFKNSSITLLEQTELFQYNDIKFSQRHSMTRLNSSKSGSWYTISHKQLDTVDFLMDTYMVYTACDS